LTRFVLLQRKIGYTKY